MKRTRDLVESRKEILTAAFSLIYARGFQGVSVDDIVKKTGLTKGAFYHQFPTKLELGYALVNEVVRPLTISRWIDPLRKSDAPLTEILKTLKRLIGKAQPAELKLGCPLNNLVQEMSSVDRVFKKHLQAALVEWIDEVEIQLKRAKRTGQIRPDVNVRHAAHFIVMAHEGFYGMLKGLDDPKAFDALYQSLEIFFNSIAA